MTRASRLRLRALALRESAERSLARAKHCRRIPTTYWQDQAAKAEALAARAIEGAERLDTEADRLIAGGLSFPHNLIGA